MACIHNQARIDDLNIMITDKVNKINKLNLNIKKCKEISDKHFQFNDSLHCIITNLEGNTVINGLTYDEGKMTECLNNSNKTMTDCSNIIIESNNTISTLETEIANLRAEISSLNGICSICLAAQEEKSQEE